MTQLHSLVKWVGGKRWAVSTIREHLPLSYSRYIEPFLGGASLFFSLQPKKAILSDLNPELINFYEVLRDNGQGLASLMAHHQKLHSKEYYYSIRAANPVSCVEQAARFLYLNKTCWNGLYRVNRFGMFNVPIGTKTVIYKEEDMYCRHSNALAVADLMCDDFETVIDIATDGDIVFADPPYTVLHNANNFIKYNDKLFSWDDQIRLRNAVMKATERGATVIVTNADHESIHSLFSVASEYIQLCRSSVLSGKASSRQKTTEALFLFRP